MGEIVWINTNTVPPHQTWLERQEIPFTCSSFKYITGIDVQLIEQHSQFIHQRNIEITLRTQRDLNIALVNELAVLFDQLDINTRDVLEAAASKWNFLPFKPGLVGGHCIGVDPYYLTHKAEMIGYQPEVILAGRRINDSMAAFVAGKALQLSLIHI